MAGGSAQPNDLWGMNFARRHAEAAAAGASRTTGAAGLGDAPDAGLDFTPPPQPGPRVVPAPAAPGAKIKAKDVRNRFDNLTFWDRMMKTPEWERGVQGVGDIREAEVVRAAKPDALEAAALRAEADHKATLAEADRLQAAGRYSEARQKRINADADFQKAQDATFVTAKTNEVKDAEKKAADFIKNAKKKKTEVWADRKKGAVRGGIIGGTALGLGVLGNEMMEDWLAGENASPENQAANEIMNRILMGGETTPEEDALVIEKLGSEEAFLKLKSSQGAAAPMVEPTLDPTAAPSRPPGPPLRDPAAGMIDVAYREGAGKPEVPGVEETFNADAQASILRGDPAVIEELKSDPELYAQYLENPEGTLAALASNYADETAAEDHRRRANALTDAGIENTAAAAGMPDNVMNYLRDQGEYARAADAGAAPVSDNWWNNLVANPMKESLAKEAEFYADPANRQGSPVLRAYDSLPEWAQGGLDTADYFINPITIGRNLMATTTNEAAAMPYEFGRNTLLGPGAFTGLNDEAFGPAYAEMMRSMGGETLGADPVTAPITEGAAPIYGPADMSDMGGGMGSGTGTGNAGMPSMEELAQLEEMGALGVNPDGSNMTVAQYIQQGNLAGVGMEPALPMFGGAPDQSGMPPLPMLTGQPNFGGPPAPPMDPRLSLPMGGMPAAPPMPAPVTIDQPIIEPGGQGDQFAGGGFFGPAVAGTMPEDEQARDDVITSLIENDEVSNPRGQTDNIVRSPRPQSRPAGLNEAAAPVVAATEPSSTAPAVEVPATPGGRPAPGAVGDFNVTRERGDAGLAEDAAVAEEELNWINRMMRDKLNLDASQRAKAAEALISGGAAMLASRGDGWQAFGEGVQAGLGSVQAADAADAEAAFASQEVAWEEERWRQEMALKDLQARRGGGAAGGGMPADIQKLEYLTGIFFEQLIGQGMTEDQAAVEAQKMAMDRIFETEGEY